MSTKVSGLILVISAVVFTITAVISKQTYYYGIALMCLAVGLFIAFAKERRNRQTTTRHKGRFQQ